MDPALIDKLSGISNSVLDARAKSEAAVQAAEDEVNILTREATLLKLRDQICELRKKYGLECNFKP